MYYKTLFRALLSAVILLAAPTANGAAAVNVAVSPTSGTVSVGKTLQFSAKVTPATNPSLTWSVNGVPGGNSATGTISTGGLYTAPAAVPTPSVVTVVATSTADPTKSAQATVTVTGPSVVSVTISPASASVNLSQTKQFSAVVSGSSDTAVTWSVSGVVGGNTTVGTVSASGLYTAPAAVPSPANVTVVATSVADTTKSAQAAVAVVSGVSVMVSPAAATLAIATTQQFGSTVTGSSNTAVTWSVNGVAGGNSSVGTISTGGLYTAPMMVPSPASVQVTATSTADSTKSSQASITIALALSPTAITVGTQQSAQFKAAGGRKGTSYTWSVGGIVGGNGTVGTITTQGMYTAPTMPPNPSTTTITATTSSAQSGQANLTVVPVTVAVAPTSASVPALQTRQFSATVGNTSNTAVTWNVNGVAGGNSTVGTVSASGLYTAPAAVPSGSVAVTAVSVADTSKSAQAAVTVLAVVSVTMSPTSASVPVSRTQQFSATVSGSSNTVVTWNVNGVAGGNSTVGTVSSSGLYTAPSAVPSGNVTVTGVSAADASKSASATVTVQSVVSITLSPTGASVPVSQTQQFTATVSGSSNTSVTWNVNGVAGGNSTVGTVSASGLFTAPSTVPSGSVTVTAVSAADTTKSAQAAVTVLSVVSITLSPTSASVPASQTQQFTATVSGSSNTGVNWNVNGVAGGNPTVGTVSASGLYTAPAKISPGSVTVTAVSAADATKSAGATVIVTAPTLTVMTSSIPNGEVGIAYNATVVTTGGTTPYTWTILSGLLPPGVGIGTTSGAIGGTPLAAGAYTVTVQSSDAHGQTASKALSFVIAAALTITPTVPSGTVGVAYHATLESSGGTPPVTWTLSSGALPAGLALNSSGSITGTPSSARTNTFTVQATDSAGGTAVQSYSLLISAASNTVTLGNTTLPNGTVGAAYAATLSAAGGMPPYTWSVSSGTLPSALTLNQSTGLVFGTPTAAGLSSFTVQVTDSVSNSTTISTSINISPSLDLYGGRTDITCAGPRPQFYTQKIGLRWWLCTPLGNAFFFQGVSNISWNNVTTDAGYNYQGIISSKFANDPDGWQYGWADNSLTRLKAWGFNAVGDSGSSYVNAWGPGGARIPATKLPSIPEQLSSLYSFENRSNYLPAGTVEKNLMDVVVGTAYTGYVGRGLPDVFDPGYAAYLAASWAKTVADPYYSKWLMSPYALGVVVDESDDIFGLAGPGLGIPSAPDGVRHPHVGWITLALPPRRYASAAAIAGSNWNLTYNDPTVFSKLELRKELDQTTYPTGRYSTIGALNAAWGSNYTTFGSSGTQYTDESVGTGDGTTRVFSGNLAHSGVDHFSVGVKVAGTVVGGDMGNGSVNPQNAFASSTVFGYNYNEFLVFFTTPPPKDAVLSLTYTYTACGGGTATTQWGVGDGVTQAYNSDNQPPITWACGYGKGVASVPGTMIIKVNGVAQGSDSGGAPAISGPGVGSSFVNYSTGAYSLTFLHAPPNGAPITIDYHTNGWSNGGTGLMDEDGSHTSWLGHTDGLLDPAYASEGAITDLDSFLLSFSNKYFGTHRDAFKAASPTQLMFCPQLNNHGGLTRSQTLQAAGSYCDVIQAGANNQALLDATVAYTGDVPLFQGFIGSAANPDSSLHNYANPGGDTYVTQAQRGDYVINAVAGTLYGTVTATGNMPNIGWTLWDWSDSWCDGGTCQRVNWGLVSSRDNAYDGLEAVTTAGVPCQAPQASYNTCGGEDSNYGDLITSVKIATGLWLSASGTAATAPATNAPAATKGETPPSGAEAAKTKKPVK